MMFFLAYGEVCWEGYWGGDKLRVVRLSGGAGCELSVRYLTVGVARNRGRGVRRL